MKSLEGQHVTEDEAHNSITSLMKRCEKNSLLAMDQIQQFKEESALLRSQIDELTECIITKCEDLEEQYTPQIRYDYQTLKTQMKAEKEENDLLYREMMSLKRENNTSTKRIQIIAAAIGRLEKSLGVKPKKPTLIS